MPISIGSERTVTGSGSGVFSYSKDGDTWSSYSNTTASSTPEVSPVNTQTSLTLSYSSGGTTLFSEDDEYLLVRNSGVGLLGSGVRSKVYTLHPRHLGRVLQVSFDYALTGANAGNYSDGDLTLWIIDVTKNTVIQPVSHRIMKAGANVPAKHIATFQTASDGSNFRVAIHCATPNTTTLPYNMKISDIKISEPTQSVGAVITDWQEYIPTFSAGFGTISNRFIQWRRVGANIEIRGRFTTASVPPSSQTFTLPFGFITNVNWISGTVGEAVGQLFQNTTSENNMVTLLARNDNLIYVGGYVAHSSGTFNPLSTSGGNILGSAIQNFYLSVPIQGWGSTVAMSSDTGDGRVVAAMYKGMVAQTSSNIPIQFNTKVFDTHGAVTLGTVNTSNAWQFKAPVSGYYRVSVSVYGSTLIPCFLWKNGSQQYIRIYTATTDPTSGSVSVELNAGEYIDVRTSGGAAAAYGDAYISIERISAGTQQIAATETVACEVWTDTNTTSSTTANVILNRVNRDTHGTWNTSTGIYTAPMSGWYNLSGVLNATAQNITVHLYKSSGGVLTLYKMLSSNSAISAIYSINSGSVYLLSGEQISLRTSVSATFYGASPLNANTSWITIHRIGI